MGYQIVHDKKTIEIFCRNNPSLHLYSLGDLDDFFWKYTTWFGLMESGLLSELVLLYLGASQPTILGFTDNPSLMKKLLESILGFLPRQFNAHLSPGLEEVLTPYYLIKPYGKNYKMTLKNKSAIKNVDYSGVIRLSTADHESIRKLFEQSYPDNWFDRRMLETNQYFGIREGNQLVSIAGVHVYSETYRVAALGNINTLPCYRKKGFGKKVTGRLCQSLLETTDHIGLNVKSDNHYAIRLYEHLGFKKVASYNEFVMEVK